MPSVPQVHCFQDEDQILSHLAAKSVSACVLYLLHQSVSSPGTRTLLHFKVLHDSDLWQSMHFHACKRLRRWIVLC